MTLYNLPQVLATTATGNIHQVTINAANDMLTEPELQTAITSLSSAQSLHPGNLRPSPHPSLLPPAMSLSSTSRQREVTSTPMVIEPELVDSGALQHSPTPEETIENLLADSREGVQNPPLRVPSSRGSVQNAPSILTGTQGDSQNIPPLLPTTQIQLEQLEPQLSNMLVQTSDSIGPEQYVIEPTPVLELVSAAAHTVTINPTTAVNLSSRIIQQEVALPVSKSNQLSSTLTPIDALEQSTSQGKDVYSSLASHVAQSSLDTPTSS